MEKQNTTRPVCNLFHELLEIKRKQKWGNHCLLKEYEENKINATILGKKYIMYLLNFVSGGSTEFQKTIWCN
jgi:hypothetical protein